MRIEVYGDEQPEEDKVLRLKLSAREHGEGTISLRAVNKYGEYVMRGNLIHITLTDEGKVTFTRASGVSQDLGLDLVNGEIVVK